MGVHAYELAADGSDWDETAANETTEQLNRVTGTGLYPYRVTQQIAFDLNGGTALTYPLIHAERALTLYKVILLYTEATSADAGITVEVGKETDRNYYWTGDTGTSVAQWYEADLTLLQTDIAAGDTLTVYSPNNKVGTGEISFTIIYGVTPS